MCPGVTPTSWKIRAARKYGLTPEVTAASIKISAYVVPSTAPSIWEPFNMLVTPSMV